MLLTIPAVLSAQEVADFRNVLAAAEWADGKVTAGYQSAVAKNNLQLPEASAEARELGERVLSALQRSPLFLSGALPLKVFPPLFNRYGVGHAFGSRVDICRYRSWSIPSCSAKARRCSKASSPGSRCG